MRRSTGAGGGGEGGKGGKREEKSGIATGAMKNKQQTKGRFLKMS